MIEQRYQQWIAAHYPTSDSAWRQCAEATLDMKEAFPELTRVRGHLYLPFEGEHSHWWLKTPDGTIIDPTAIQFNNIAYGEYIERDETQPEPTGKCPNCGEFCYDNNYCCSDECGVAYVAYCNNPW